MSAEIEGPGGFQRGTASRSGDRVNPFGRLLWYLSCRNKKDTRRRHQHLFFQKTHYLSCPNLSTPSVECGKIFCGIKFSKFCFHRPCGKLSEFHIPYVEKKTLRL